MRAGSLSRDGSPGLAASWEILTGRTGALTPYVTVPRGPQVPPAEGWAHMMDRERCTAVAVADFACPGQEADITIDADGRLQIWKSFAWGGTAAPPGPKKLTFC